MTPDDPRQTLHIDESVPEEVQPVMEWFVTNLRLLGMAAAAIVLVVAAWAAWTEHQHSRIAKAKEELGRVMVLRDPAQRIEALEKHLTEAPEALLPTIKLELAASLMQARRYEQAATVWSGLTGSGEPSLGLVAAMGQAASLTSLGKPAEALQVLEAARKSTPEGLAPILDQQIASTAEAAGDIPRALALYSSLLDKAQEQQKDFLEFKIGRLKARQANAG